MKRMFQCSLLLVCALIVLQGTIMKGAEVVLVATNPEVGKDEKADRTARFIGGVNRIARFPIHYPRVTGAALFLVSALCKPKFYHQNLSAFGCGASVWLSDRWVEEGFEDSFLGRTVGKLLIETYKNGNSSGIWFDEDITAVNIVTFLLYTRLAADVAQGLVWCGGKAKGMFTSSEGKTYKKTNGVKGQDSENPIASNDLSKEQ